MKAKAITKKIVHCEFEKQKDLTSTFLRFQEYYESPEFAGKVFTLNEYKKWYIANSIRGKKTKKFTYYSDWAGFNIPSIALEPFYAGLFDPLSKREKDFLSNIEELMDKQLITTLNENKFYIIGTFKCKEQQDVLKHELAHALFTTNKKYKEQVIEILSKVNLTPLKQYLKRLGYNKAVWLDESHAYLLSNDLNSLEKYGIKEESYRETKRKLKLLFRSKAKNLA